MFLKNKNENKNILNIYALNTDGIIYASVFPEALGTDVSERDYFIRAMKGDTSIVCDVVYSDRLNSNVNMISLPIYDKDTIAGVIVAVLDVSAYAQIVDTFNHSNMEYYITDTAGNLVYAKDKFLIGTPLDLDKIPDSGKNTFIDNGIEKQAFYTTVPDIGWKIISMSSVQAINAPLIKMISTIVVSSIILLLIALIIFYFISPSISLPIKEITRQVKK